MKPNSKLFDSIRIRPKKEAEASARGPKCQWNGCEEAGTHRAPVGRMKEGEYFHFCIDHVRLYNKNFNYFSGLSDSDIASFQKDAMTGHRPTWSAGVNAAAAKTTAPQFAQARSGRAAYHNKMGDPFNLFGAKAATPKARKPKPLEAKALETLGLGANSTGDQIKARYKELVKLHHPDANGGDRASEDRFRDVIQAYQLLRQAGLC